MSNNAQIQPTEQIEVSIIIVNWNAGDLLKSCLRSITAYVRSTTFEVIVVDNASTDGSSDLAGVEFPEAELIKNQENVGFSRANNQAIRRSRGPYLLLLNPDAVLLNDILAEIKQLFTQYPDVGIIGPKLVTPDDRLQRWARGNILSLPTAFNHYLFLSELFPRSRFFQGIADNADYDHLTDMGWVSGACLAVRRSLLDQVGLLDESIFMYSEDMELCYRARQAGYRVVYAPTAQVKHFVSQSLHKQTDEAILAGPIMAQDTFYRRLYGRKGLRLFRVVICLGTLIRLILRSAGYALRPGERSRYRLYEARRHARAAWQLLKKLD
jgi:hypothetical protein